MNTQNTRAIARSTAIVLAAAAASGVARADDKAGQPLEEIIVTASPLPRNADDLATIVGTVDRQEILQLGGAQLADSLANVPSVVGTSFAAGASRPVIRGFDANRVRVLEDGIGSADVSDVGPDHGVPIDPLSAQRIEVVRGAATLRYGSQAIGGVVNAINDRVPSELPEQPLTGTVSGAYGSVADSGDGSALLDGRLGQFALHADGFYRHTDDYDIPGGTQPNSYFHGYGYALGGSYFFGDDRVGLAGVHYDSTYGIPSDTTYIDMQQTKFMTRSSFALGDGAFKTLNVDGGYADYKHTERDPDGGAALSTFKNTEWEARAESLLGAIGPFTSSALGAQYSHKDFSALGEGADYLRPTTTQSSALFLFTEAPINARLGFEMGARVEYVTVDGTPASGRSTSQDFTPFSLSAGLVFDASDVVRLGLTLSSAARAPGQTELFASGPHDGPGTFETGDPSLSAERSNSIEGTIRVRYNNVRIEGALWDAEINNYIYGALTGRTCDDEGNCAFDDTGELRELNYGQQDARFWGAEGRAVVTISKIGSGDLDAEFLADYVRATFNDGGNVARIPPYHIGGGLRWTGSVVDAGFLVKQSGRQNDVATGETPTAGFTNVDAHVGWYPVRGNTTLELLLIGQNLTNSTQRSAVSLNKDFVVLPGRGARMVVRVSF